MTEVLAAPLSRLVTHRLPPGEGAAWRTPCGDGTKHAASHGRRLLIVDDDAPLLTMLTLHLQDQGFDVVRADSVARALGLFEPKTFRFALLDYRLPDGSGLDLGITLRRSDPGIGLLMMSGCAENDLASRACEAGFGTFLRKPFVTHRLDLALREL